MTDSSLLEQELEARLVDWGQWAARAADHVGYPRMSIEGALQVNGGVYVRGIGAKSPELNEAAEEVEAWIVTLGFYNSKLSQAITLKYTGRYGTLDELARRHGIHPRTFRDRIASAKDFLMGRLIAKLEAANDTQYFAVNY